MNARIADYDVFPSVVKSGENVEISIKPRGDHAKFDDAVEYVIKFVPMECCNVEYELSRFEGNFNTQSVKSKNGSITFTYCFAEEQEWSVVIQEKNSQQNKVFHIYSVFPDLYAKKAYKGDFHVHSNRSDGNEEPGVVAANYRKAGFDFIAITDHHRWRPSKEAIDKYKNVDIDLKLFLGEEVHVYLTHQIFILGQFSLLFITTNKFFNIAIILLCATLTGIVLQKLNRLVLNKLEQHHQKFDSSAQKIC